MKTIRDTSCGAVRPVDADTDAEPVPLADSWLPGACRGRPAGWREAADPDAAANGTPVVLNIRWADAVPAPVRPIEGQPEPDGRPLSVRFQKAK